ncbi:MAG: hypothetical protein AAB563_01895 [Patescibacteria group bacterium]
MNNLHLFEKTLGNGMVRAKCGQTLRTAHCVAISTISSPDGQGVCDRCLSAYYKEVLPARPVVMSGTLTKKSPLAAAI